MWPGGEPNAPGAAMRPGPVTLCAPGGGLPFRPWPEVSVPLRVGQISQPRGEAVDTLDAIAPH